MSLFIIALNNDIENVSNGLSLHCVGAYFNLSERIRQIIDVQI